MLKLLVDGDPILIGILTGIHNWVEISMLIDTFVGYLNKTWLEMMKSVMFDVDGIKMIKVLPWFK